MTQFHELQMNSISGEQINFSDYRNQVCLIVNVASE